MLFLLGNKGERISMKILLNRDLRLHEIAENYARENIMVDNNPRNYNYNWLSVINYSE